MVKSANKTFLGYCFFSFPCSLCPNKFKSSPFLWIWHKHIQKKLSAVGFSLCCNSLAFMTEVFIMEIQFPEPSVTLFTSLLNLKLAATAALRRAMTGHPDGWDDRRKDTLSFFTSKTTAEPLRLQSPRLLFSIVCTKTFKSRTRQRKTQTRSRKFLTQQEKQVKSPQSSNQTQQWRSAMFVQT